MKIKHDKEYYSEMIAKLKQVHENIDDFTFRIEDISDRLYKMNTPVSRVLEDAIDDLEQKLIYDFKDNFEDFIDTIKEGSELLVDTDEDIKTIVSGGV